MKQIVTQEVCSFDFDEVNFPEKPNEFLAFWKEKIDLIPEEYKETARIELKLKEEGYWDCTSYQFTISFTRPETDQEQAKREKQENSKADAIKIKELKKLAELKQKYDNE